MAEVAQQHNEPRYPSDVNAWFFGKRSLEELLVGAKPLRFPEDLMIEDLTPDEATSFLRAIEE